MSATGPLLGKHILVAKGAGMRVCGFRSLPLVKSELRIDVGHSDHHIMKRVVLSSSNSSTVMRARISRASYGDCALRLMLAVWGGIGFRWY
jgi:hypothetical protein